MMRRRWNARNDAPTVIGCLFAVVCLCGIIESDAFSVGSIVPPHHTSSWRNHASPNHRWKTPRSIDDWSTKSDRATKPVAATNGDNDNNNNRRRKKVPNPLVLLRRVWVGVGDFRRTFAARFAALSRRGKALASAQLMVLLLVLGSFSRRAVVGASSSPSSRKRPVPTEMSYGSFLDLLEGGGRGRGGLRLDGDGVVVGRERVSFRVAASDAADAPSRPAYAARPPALTPDLLDALRRNRVDVRAASARRSNAAATTARGVVAVVYVLFLARLYKSMSGTGGGGGAPGRLARSSDRQVRFEDVEGVDEAKYQVMEFVDALRNPNKYRAMGARAPKGLLLVGPPGTGKTMLARATAATAGLPMLYCSGSDFVEMFVGRGAARVRKTFARAAKMAPCIVFVDELDALGKSRDASGLRLQSNDEAEQTLNQLLACMDGLASRNGVVVLAATNRREVLDPALVRPGRFDRIVRVDPPDAGGRERVLRSHARRLPGFVEGNGVDPRRRGALGDGRAVDLGAVAAVTAGLSGAELEVVVNEAALRAVRRAGVDNDDDDVGVRATDFEESLASFFETRKGVGNGGGVGDFVSSFFKE